MGCDIHFFVEKKNEKGEWESVDKWEEEDGRMTVVYESRFYSDRNYSLFSILANVRNGYGFAGVPTGTGFIPISQPRDLPDDVSEQVRTAAGWWAGDGHSHSWFTLAELLAYDWTQVTTKMGVVDAWAVYEWNRWPRKEGESPRSWSGSVSGSHVQVLLGEDLDKWLEDWCRENPPGFGLGYRLWKEKFDREFNHVYGDYVWTQPYYQTCERFWSRTIPRLLRLGKPEDVRAVFWFDN